MQYVFHGINSCKHVCNAPSLLLSHYVYCGKSRDVQMGGERGDMQSRGAFKD